MNYLESKERQQLIVQVLTATTLPEITTATTALKHWVEEHPDDLGIIDGFEQLSLMEDCARAREEFYLPVAFSARIGYANRHVVIHSLMSRVDA